ncbi:MAG TPA: flagellar M-ring protein FliF C-terminal domain-containing protein [Phycisphaerae bacterium]
MDLIRKYLTQIKSQLAGLTISQKLLIGLLGIFMVGTIFWTVVWSAKPQMVTLIPQSMTAEEINRAEMAMKGKYQYQVSGDKILVPLEQAYAIRGELASDGALPKNLSTAFTAVIANQNPFKPDKMNEREWNNARQEELSKWLSSFPYVESGSVMIEPGERQTIGRAPMPSTAAVYIKTKNGEINQSQVTAIIDLITASVSGMKRENVSLNVNGLKTYHMPSDENNTYSSNMIEYKKTVEDYLTDQLRKLFDSMGDVRIAVNVVPDLSTKEINKTDVDPKNSVQKAKTESSMDSANVDGNVPQGEPGMKSNTGASVADTAPSGGRPGGSTSTTVKTDYAVVIGEIKTRQLIPAGVEIHDLTASISLPRSYVLALYHSRKPDADPKVEPKDADLQPFMTEQEKSVTALAKNAIGAKTDDQIHVAWYDDSFMLKAPVLASGQVTLASGAIPLIGQYAKQGVLAIVALGALGMMLMMVRRAVPAGTDEEIGSAAIFGGGGGKGSKGRKKGGVEQFDSDEIFGEANEGEAVLTGIELDDETLASRKMVDEVSTMIKENPENAAALVKRWMSKTK